MHDWLKHLQDIFNYPKIDCIWFTTDSSQFDIDDIKEVFGTSTKVKIGNTECYTFNQMILQNFLSVKKLSIKPSHFPNSKVAERILMQNFDGLEIGDGWVETRIMSLDQLLLINSKKVFIYGVQIPAKHFNKFIKLWQRGSNSQLEWFAIHYTITNEEDGKEAIMKGIKHEIIPANQIRKFKATGNAMPEIVEGGIDIVRKDEFTTVEWEKREFAMKNCLEHLQNAFNHHKIDGIWFCHFFSSQFDIDDIREAFGNITKVYIGVTGCFVFNQMILQKFFPIEDLSVMTENFQDLKIPLSVLMQNRLKLRIAHDGLPINVTLNDLLLTNSKVITVENPQMPQKLLNNFLKLWQRGSNPHMEYLSFDYFDSVENDEEIIMQGIKHEVNPLDRVRNFKSMGFKNLREVRGGMNVYRMDGARATITLRKTDFFSFSQMFVWFDHCAVKT
ncbi:hypothetical protein CAEBREN_21632 [Caenorhabditis brenneri]|uniref:Sdz-33 F-box domain-containing protein n=1 Tax=Caenorhabditis brenneri TaxID=135651 RepID=G0N0H1_CAEBE|nr:hypothetical protein CAEBREN_21632 [Caenorhabditis brenneri]